MEEKHNGYKRSNKFTDSPAQTLAIFKSRSGDAKWRYLWSLPNVPSFRATLKDSMKCYEDNMKLQNLPEMLLLYRTSWVVWLNLENESWFHYDCLCNVHASISNWDQKARIQKAVCYHQHGCCSLSTMDRSKLLFFNPISAMVFFKGSKS